jgi:hypothetical protein
MNRLLPTAALSIVALATTIAHADPAFITVDRFDDSKRAGAAVSYLNVDSPGLGAQRFELFGHYVHATRFGGFGGYGAFAVARETIDNDDNHTALGNLELGALWTSTPSQLPFPLIVRFGYVLQTAGDDLEDNFANTLASYARFTDRLHATSDVGWVRMSTSATHRSGKGFYRVDLGIDLPAAGEAKGRTDRIVRLNLAAGIDNGNTAMTFELVNSGTFDNVDDGDPRFSHVVALGGRYLAAGRIRPSLALALPLDNPGKEQLNWMLLLGADYVF